MERKEKSVIRRGAEIAFYKADAGAKSIIYKPSKALDEYVSTREKQISENQAAIKQALEKKQAKKEAEKAKKEAEKEAKKAEREAKKAEFSWGFKKRDFEDNEEQPSRFHFNWFNKKNSKEEYEVIFIDQIRDKDQKPFVKPLKGRNLLKRDFDSTPLYIESHGDFLKVISAEIIESDHAGVVTVELSTCHGEFLVDFPMDF